MEINIMGRVRKLLEALDYSPGGTPEQIALTEQMELLVAQATPVQTEITRLGRSFFANTTSAVAAVVAIPTTAHMFSIYNNEPDGGRSLIIDWLAASNVVSTAVAGQAQILGNLGQVRETAPTDAALVIKKLNGLGGGVDSRVRTLLTGAALPATTGIAANWFPLGSSSSKPGVAGTPGYGIWVPIEGRIIVPPGRYFAMHVLANVVGETFQGFIGWHEKQLTLG